MTRGRDASECPWFNLEVVGQGREEAHADFVAYEDRSLALSRAPRHASKRFVDLTGPWPFAWSPNALQVPAGFHEPGFDDREWSTIPVPGSWELNGYGPLDIEHGGADPDHNPTGAYRRHFEVPEGWLRDDWEVFLHIGAVCGACQVWLNGAELGFSSDSKLPVEFKLTNHLVSGKNVLAMQVLQWPSAVCLEHQDTWCFAGIQRDVYIFARPRQHISDIQVRAAANGILQLDAVVATFPGAMPLHNLTCSLFACDQCGCAIGESITTFSASVRQHSTMTLVAAATVTVPNVQCWTAETPWLYQLLVELSSDRLAAAEVIPIRVGFRTVEVKMGRLLLNGKELTIRGVNRREHDMCRGPVISKDSMLEDIRLMKTHNFNAVRNSHYPNDPLWYELCDQHGLYLVDEVNIGSQGIGLELTHQQQWSKAHAVRTKRMVERSKNHPSVITWSLGNGAGDAMCPRRSYTWLKRRDPTRPVQYENPCLETAWFTGDVAESIDMCTDIYCPMCPSHTKLHSYAEAHEELTDALPLIMCEYGHAMGNGSGIFDSYWELISRYHILQGGFIWDWIDQSTSCQHACKEHCQDGGDIEGPGFLSEHSFCINGLVRPDRTPSPLLHKAKKGMQPVGFQLEPDADRETPFWTIRVVNYYGFRSLEHLDFHWSFSADGHELFASALPPLTTTAGGVGQFRVSLPHTPSHLQSADCECHLLVCACWREGSMHGPVPAGHEEAWEQWSIPPPIADTGVPSVGGRDTTTQLSTKPLVLPEMNDFTS